MTLQELIDYTKEQKQLSAGASDQAFENFMHVIKFGKNGKERFKQQHEYYQGKETAYDDILFRLEILQKDTESE